MITHIDEMKKLEDHPNQTYMVFDDYDMPTLRQWFRETYGYMDYDYNVVKAWENIQMKPTLQQYKPKEKQVAGSHYQLPIQPIDYITKNQLGFIEGNVIKYVTRYKNKNGLEDLKKAQHYLEMLIEEEERRYANTN